MYWLHGTSSQNANNIVQHGFDLPIDYGIWGNGIYFTHKLEEAECYGNSILKVNIKNDDILTLDYQQDICELFPELSIEDEEGTPLLKSYVLEQNKKGVVVNYSKDDCNLILYDLSAIDKIL